MTVKVYIAVKQPIGPTNRFMRVLYVWTGRGWMPLKRELV